jgi:hypothetical protein
MQDPILTPIFISGLTAAGVTAEVAAIAGPILTAIVVTGGTAVAVTLLTPKPPKPDDGKFAFLQTVPDRIWVAGEARIAGSTMLLEEKDGNLYVVQALASHLVGGINRFFLNDDEVTPDGSGFVPEGADGRYEAQSVRLLTRLGLSLETAYSQIVSALPGTWTNDHRGDGTASLAMICQGTKLENFSKRYPYQKPSPSVVIEGAYMFDPRMTGHDPDDPSTWETTKNLALAILWHLCHNEFGFQEDYAVAIAPVLEEWIEEADICDEPFSLDAGGTEPRYHGGGWDVTGRDPKVGLREMLTACDGILFKRGDGAYILRVGKFRDKGVVITDADIEGFHIDTGNPDRDAVNFLQVKYTSPDHQWTEVEADPWSDEADQLQRGKKRDGTLEATWAHSFTHARRLGKREQFRQSEKLRGTLDLRMSALNALYERWIYVESAYSKRLNGRWIENRGGRIRAVEGGVYIEFLGADPAIEDWYPATDEGEAPIVPERPESLGPSAPANVNYDAQAVALGGGALGVRLLVSFDVPTRTDLTYVLRWRVKDADTGTPGDQPSDWKSENHSEDLIEQSDRLRFFSDIVTGDTILEVELAAKANGLSPFSPTEEVDTTVDPVPPAPVESLAGVPITSGVSITWTAPNSANFDAGYVYRNTVNDFPTSSLIEIVFGAPNDPQGHIDEPLSAGTYYYWVTAANGSAVESVEQATGAMVVT